VASHWYAAGNQDCLGVYFQLGVDFSNGKSVRRLADSGAPGQELVVAPPENWPSAGMIYLRRRSAWLDGNASVR